MSDNEDSIFHLKVSPHNYEAVNWKHQTFKDSFDTWHVSILKKGSKYNGSISREKSMNISLADMKIKLTFKNLTYAFESKVIATFKEKYSRFFFEYSQGERGFESFSQSEVDIEVDTSLCSDAIQCFNKPASKIVVHAMELFESGKFADIVIKTDENEILAHSFILSRSNIFEAMLNANMKEAEEKVIEITDIDYDVLLEMIRFLYCDEVPKMNEMAIDLLVAGDKYNIQDLVDECGAYLLQNVTMENHGIILATADRLNIQSLKELAIDFVVENRKEIFATESWRELKQNNVQLALEIMEKNMSIS